MTDREIAVQKLGEAFQLLSHVAIDYKLSWDDQEALKKAKAIIAEVARVLAG